MRWTDTELMQLNAYYPDHGGSWPGWREVLPDRTIGAITRKALEVGIYDPSKAYPTRQSTAFGLLMSGLAPSEIDMQMHWVDGEAHRLIVKDWAENDEKRERALQQRTEFAFTRW